MISLKCGIQKNNTNECTHKTETDTENKVMATKGEGKGRWEGKIRSMGLTKYYI